jgi:FAD linked oxidases, C-terminal domain
MLQPLEFIREAEAIELAWHVRDGLLGIVGEMRPQGTNLIIEDVCFPPAQLASATRDLLGLLAKHGYEPSAAGHAAYGNLHFVMIAQLNEDASRQRYDGFMRNDSLHARLPTENLAVRGLPRGFPERPALSECALARHSWGGQRPGNAKPHRNGAAGIR